MTNPYELHVRQDGDPGAPALLLIHASGSSTIEWDPIVPMLAGSHRVIRVDLLGHGESPKPGDGDYAVPTQAGRVATVLDRLGVTRAVVAGHSSGGYTTTALAERRPDLVTALALINSGPGPEAVIPPPGGGDPAVPWPLLDDAQLLQLASVGFSRVGYRPPFSFLDAVRRMTFHSFTTTMRESSAYIAEKTVPDRLTAVGKPLLVIWGEDDKRYRRSSIDAYRAVPGARVEPLPGLGHSPNMEDPGKSAELLLAFAAAHAAAVG